MIRSSLRALGFVLMATAFAALVVDGTRSIADGHLLQSSLGDIATWLDHPRYAAWVESLGREPEPGRRIASAILAAPGWLVTGGLGLLLLFAGRPAAHIGLPHRRT